jgi:hypothetical protein
MKRIEIDDEVYALLEQNVKGFEQPNDVLRRLLALDGGSSKPGAVAGATGRLYPFITAGLLKPGDGLEHHQPRKGRTLKGEVRPDGFIKTELGVYKEPSPALGKLVGTQIDGWANWRHVPSGQTLRQLRFQLEQGDR